MSRATAQYNISSSLNCTCSTRYRCFACRAGSVVVHHTLQFALFRTPRSVVRVIRSHLLANRGFLAAPLHFSVDTDSISATLKTTDDIRPTRVAIGGTVLSSNRTIFRIRTSEGDVVSSTGRVATFTNAGESETLKMRITGYYTSSNTVTPSSSGREDLPPSSHFRVSPGGPAGTLPTVEYLTKRPLSRHRVVSTKDVDSSSAAIEMAASEVSLPSTRSHYRQRGLITVNEVSLPSTRSHYRQRGLTTVNEVSLPSTRRVTNDVSAQRSSRDDRATKPANSSICDIAITVSTTVYVGTNKPPAKTLFAGFVLTPTLPTVSSRAHEYYSSINTRRVSNGKLSRTDVFDQTMDKSTTPLRLTLNTFVRYASITNTKTILESSARLALWEHSPTQLASVRGTHRSETIGASAVRDSAGIGTSLVLPRHSVRDGAVSGEVVTPSRAVPVEQTVFSSDRPDVTSSVRDATSIGTDVVNRRLAPSFDIPSVSGRSVSHTAQRSSHQTRTPCLLADGESRLSVDSGEPSLNLCAGRCDSTFSMKHRTITASSETQLNEWTSVADSAAVLSSSTAPESSRYPLPTVVTSPDMSLSSVADATGLPDAARPSPTWHVRYSEPSRVLAQATAAPTTRTTDVSTRHPSGKCPASSRMTTARGRANIYYSGNS